MCFDTLVDRSLRGVILRAVFFPTLIPCWLFWKAWNRSKSTNKVMGGRLTFIVFLQVLFVVMSVLENEGITTRRNGMKNYATGLLSNLPGLIPSFQPIR